MHLFKSVSVIITLCLTLGFTGTLSAQQLLSELDSYTWKEKSVALESLAALQAQGKESGVATTSVHAAHVEGAMNFSRVLYKKVSDKITDNVAIKTAIIDGFNETVAGLASTSVGEDAQLGALETLVTLLKE